MNVCFSDISGIQSLTYAQFLESQRAWNTFRQVEQFNSNVSTQRFFGAATLTYWQFPTTTSYEEYKRGLSLHTSYLGFSTVVQKN